MTTTLSQQRTDQVRGVSQWALAWRRLKKNRVALAGLAIVALFALFAVFDGWPFVLTQNDKGLFALYPPECVTGFSPACPYSGNGINALPDPSHPFGTDARGHDVYSEIVYGSAAAFIVGLGATGISMIIAIVIGLAAGYFGGWIDNVLMRLTEVFLVIPFFLLLLVFLQIMIKLNPSATGGLWLVVFIIGAFSWPGAARIIRGEVLRVREFEYITASQQIGASSTRILFRHLFPNVLHIIIVLFTLGIATSVLTEAAVSFLGFGAPNSNTWGQQMNIASFYINQAWWAITFPAIFLTIFVMGFNLLGNGLRDALDPRLRE
jgi:ABC-type dipeptide/oligopeptide/nickel transport system permease subunit